MSSHAKSHPISGTFTPPVHGIDANDPSVRLNPALADGIGRVLARLHAIPPEAAAAARVGAADVYKADVDVAIVRLAFELV
jgi:hypothetical protein